MDQAKQLLEQAKSKSKEIINQFGDILEADKKGDYSEVINLLVESSNLGLHEADIQLGLIHCDTKKHKDLEKTATYFKKIISSLTKKLDECSKENKGKSYFELSYPYYVFSDKPELEALIGNTKEKFIKFSDLALQHCNDPNLEVEIYSTKAAYFQYMSDNNSLNDQEEVERCFRRIVRIDESTLITKEARHMYNEAFLDLEEISEDINRSLLFRNKQINNMENKETSEIPDLNEKLKDDNVELEKKELNIFDRTLFDLVSKSLSENIANQYIKTLDNKRKLAMIVQEIVTLTISKTNLPKIHLMNPKQQNGTGLFLCLFTAAITNIYTKLNPDDKIKNDEIHLILADLIPFPMPEKSARFVQSSVILTDKFLLDPKGIGMFKIIEYKLIIFLNNGKNPNNMVEKIPMPLSFEPASELSFENFCEEYLTSLIVMTVIEDTKNSKQDDDVAWAQKEFLKDMERRNKHGIKSTFVSARDKPDSMRKLEEHYGGVTVELVKSKLRKGNFDYRESRLFIEVVLKKRKGGFFRKAQPPPTLSQLRELDRVYNPDFDLKWPGHADILFSKEIVEHLGFYVDENNQVFEK